MNWQEYIISDPKILIGKPIIKGTRISVELILELFSLGFGKIYLTINSQPFPFSTGIFSPTLKTFAD